MGKNSVRLVDDFPEFAGNKRLHWIAEEWLCDADRLAEWTMEHLVNRRDVWSQYIVKNGEVGVVMLPVKERRKSGAEMVTMNKLRRHFSGGDFTSHRPAFNKRSFDVQVVCGRYRSA